MRHGSGRLVVILLPLLIIGSSGVAIAGAHPISTGLGSASSRGAISHPLTVNATKYSSYYAAGWILTSSSTVSNVKGSWIVPRVHGTCGSATTMAISYIGIEGYYGTVYTVAVIGTVTGCSGGSPGYAVVYQFAPYLGVTQSSLTIHPGNIVSASVTATTATSWHLKLTDLNTSTSVSKYFTHGGGRTQAEWLVGVLAAGSTPLYPLTNFGTVEFGHQYTSVNKTLGATIGGVSGSIAYLVKHGASAFIATLYKYSTTIVMATPSQIKSDGRSFTVTWKSKGP